MVLIFFCQLKIYRWHNYTAFKQIIWKYTPWSLKMSLAVICDGDMFAITFKFSDVLSQSKFARPYDEEEFLVPWETADWLRPRGPLYYIEIG